MADRLVIEFPSVGATYHYNEYGVYRYGVYERGSVLEGQEKRSFVGRYESLEDAQDEYPTAEWHGGGSEYREVFIPETPPAWFDPLNAGERWEDDY